MADLRLKLRNDQSSFNNLRLFPFPLSCLHVCSVKRSTWKKVGVSLAVPRTKKQMLLVQCFVWVGCGGKLLDCNGEIMTRKGRWDHVLDYSV